MNGTDFELKNKEILSLAEEQVCEKYRCFPSERTQTTLLLWCSKQQNKLQRQEAERYFRQKGVENIIWKEVPHTWIQRGISTYYTLAAANEKFSQKLDSLIQSHDISNLLEFILSVALDAEASDIHLFYAAETILVRFRLQGSLKSFCVLPEKTGQDLIRAIKVRANIDIAKNRNPRDGKMKFQYEGNEVDIRISVIPTVEEEKVHLRLLNRRNVPLEISQLGMKEKEERQLKDFLHRNSGFLLITGPTSSGKSTTMRCCINEIHNGEKHIISLEDPVEYVIEGITQVQINRENEYGFSEALRAMLRQDPNVLAIGEVRDFESCNTAIQSSLTGHFVISTLHTKNAESAIDRMISIGLSPYLLAISVGMVINQRLVRILCPHCKEKEIYSGEGISQLHLKEGMSVYIRRGCEKCGYTGYSKRQPVFQMIEFDKKRRDELEKHGTLSVSKKEDGLLENVRELFQQGEITLEEALCFCEGEER